MGPTQLKNPSRWVYRVAGMTDSGSNTIVNNVSYDAANRLLTMNYPRSQRNAQLQCARPADKSSRQRREPDVQLPLRHEQRQGQFNVQRGERRNGDLHVRYAQSAGDGRRQRLGGAVHLRSIRQSHHQTRHQPDRGRAYPSSSTSRTIRSPASTGRVTTPMATPRTAT